MSDCSNEEISDADRQGYEGGSDDDDSDIGKNQQRRRRIGCGFGKGMGKVVLHQFTKAKNKIRRKALLPQSCSGNKEGKVIIDGNGSGRGSVCKFCFSRPKVLESPNDSPLSDPNNPNFTHAMFKTLMDKNDFYSNECNPHLD